jgi:translation initiation factor IF-2
VRQTFHVSKVGTIAGAYVVEGVMTRQNDGVRVLRDNVLVYTGKLHSLKRFKDDVREVQTGYECGLGVENFNDVKVGDIIEPCDERWRQSYSAVIARSCDAPKARWQL